MYVFDLKSHKIVALLIVVEIFTTIECLQDFLRIYKLEAVNLGDF